MFKTPLKCPAASSAVVVELERGRTGDAAALDVRIDGRSVEAVVEREEGGAGHIRVHGRVFPYFAHRVDRAVHVWLGGRVYVFEMVDAGPRRAGAGAGARAGGTGDDVIKAPMPGSVLKILVNEGDAFQAQQPLIVMESMKMELSLSAPHAGCLKKLHCRAGQMVKSETVLAELAPRGEP